MRKAKDSLAGYNIINGAPNSSVLGDLSQKLLSRRSRLKPILLSDVQNHSMNGQSLPEHSPNEYI